MARKIGVCLSGCGVFDGSEIHEAVLTLLAVSNAGAEAVCMAPNVAQAHVVNHLTGQPSPGEKRNVLTESARIARGKILDLAEVKASDLDALIFPGGFGAAKNLSDYATAGSKIKVQPDVARLIREMRAANKPIGAICIAPVVMAAIVGRDLGARPSLTIGTDPATASDIAALKAEHVSCPVKEFVVDKTNKIVTTPAYMLGRNIGEVAVGVEKLVRAVLELV
jgi:enhancing lycopene biosynthesis protein 2